VRPDGSDLDTTPLLRASSSASLYPGFLIFVPPGFFYSIGPIFGGIFSNLSSAKIPLCTVIPRH
jgi:hypothetical protein